MDLAATGVGGDRPHPGQAPGDQSGKFEPSRGFGIANSTVPARVVPLPRPVTIASVGPLIAALAVARAALRAPAVSVR